MATLTQQQAANSNPIPVLQQTGEVDYIFETRVITKLYRLGRPLKEIYEASILCQEDVNVIIDALDNPNEPQAVS